MHLTVEAAAAGSEVRSRTEAALSRSGLDGPDDTTTHRDTAARTPASSGTTGPTTPGAPPEPGGETSFSRQR
ncbi:hypothetical protein [Streptomyces sp. CB02400]|uniref:hypothetical protein n=1 Tax=Streptomyces sp. CB02400 TaxID=1703944 RepID=UPI00093DA31D|nr:hypothetical protein [Streptomyces sp. CB02400]OKK03114.1 hypothetical protein AMK33_26195 [Streptomyces sp. CB02400]